MIERCIYLVALVMDDAEKCCTCPEEKDMLVWKSAQDFPGKVWEMLGQVARGKIILLDIFIRPEIRCGQAFDSGGDMI